MLNMLAFPEVFAFLESRFNLKESLESLELQTKSVWQRQIIWYSTN